MGKAFYVLVFASTHQAIQAEKDLKPLAQVQMIPTLREITAHCGVSLKFPIEDLRVVKEYLEENRKEGMDLFLVEGPLNQRIVEKVEE